MNTEKKEKTKRKKMQKKEAEQDETKEVQVKENLNPDRKNSTVQISDSVEVLETKSNLDGDSQKKGKEAEQEKPKTLGKKEIPEGFYIAHPRSIKRGAGIFPDVHSRKLAELLEAFHMFDFDRDGVINHEDLKKTFASLNRNVEDEEIVQMLTEALNPLNFDAFVILLGYKTLDLDPEEVLLDALSNWDDHHEGLISYDRILHDIMALGDKFTQEEYKHMGFYYGALLHIQTLESWNEAKTTLLNRSTKAVSALADAPVVFTKTKEKMIDYFQFSEDLCGLRKMMQRKQPN